MSRGPRERYEHPQLGPALRWLRLGLRLPQRDVSARVRAAGGSLSDAYYRQVEAGLKAPSRALALAIAASLETTPEELEHLLDAAPWSEPPPATPHAPPAAYRQAARATLARSATWSDALGAPPSREALLRELAEVAAGLDEEALARLVEVARRGG